MIGCELKQTRKSEIICHVAANEKVLDEVTESDDEVKKEFQLLLNKFLSDNYKDYRFYSNKMKKFERKNQKQQYYGEMPNDTKELFLKNKKENLSADSLVQMMKSTNLDVAQFA